MKLPRLSTYVFSFCRKTKSPPLSPQRSAEIDATITTYTFVGGVEQRRPAFPMGRLIHMLSGIQDKFAELGVVASDMASKFAEFNQAIPPDKTLR